MSNAQTITRSINAELKLAGFKKKGSAWYFPGQDVIGVLNLQKSNYDDTFFLNLGFWIRDLGETETPRDEECHVRGRADRIWSEHEPSISELLSAPEESEGMEVRLRDIKEFVRESVIPFFGKGTTLEDLSAIVETNTALQVRKVAWEKLGVTEP